MSFVFGMLFVAPVVGYVMNEVNQTIDDIINFDYKNYLQTKLKNMNLKMKTEFLEMEYKSNSVLYEKLNEEYKEYLITPKKMNDKEKFNKLKKERMHYYEMMNECRERIRVLNKEKK
jgi:hypothetical protein